MPPVVSACSDRLTLATDARGSLHSLKPVLLFILSTLTTSAAVGPPGIQWTRESQGRATIARPTKDGGYIVGGSYGDNYWVMKLGAEGNFLWQTLGNREGDEFEDPVVDVQQTSDGGFIALVETDPALDGFGREDCQVVRLNADGEVLWSRVFGADSQDWPKQIRQTPDGGYVFGASFNSGMIGNRTSPNYGDFDWWLVRLDAQGNKVSERSFCGTGADIFTTLVPTSDGGLVLLGRSSSEVSGNKTSPNQGNADIWVVRLDDEDNKVWDKSFGGAGDEYAINVWEANGILVVGGFSASFASGNKTNPISGAWIIGLDGEGNKLWERVIANAVRDLSVRAILPADDGGFFLGGNFTRPAPTFCCELFHRLERIGPADERTWELVHLAGFFLESLQRAPDGGLVVTGGASVFKTFPDALDAPPKLEAISMNAQSQRFTLTGATNTDYAIERSLDLVSWNSILTNRLFASQTQMVVQGSSDLTRTFYRARVVR